MKIPRTARNVFHFLGVAVPACYLLFGRTITVWFALFLFLACLALDTLRIRGQLRLGWADQCFKIQEQHRLSGSSFYTLAAVITVFVFEKNIAIAALLVLCISDPLASLVGRRLGSHQMGSGKSLEGAFAFFVSSFLILVASSFGPGASAAVAIIAAFTELYTPGFMDDNLSIPLVTAGALKVLG